jgi:hypothetical protein
MVTMSESQDKGLFHDFGVGSGITVIPSLHQTVNKPIKELDASAHISKAHRVPVLA